MQVLLLKIQKSQNCTTGSATEIPLPAKDERYSPRQNDSFSLDIAKPVDSLPTKSFACVTKFLLWKEQVKYLKSKTRNTILGMELSRELSPLNESNCLWGAEVCNFGFGFAECLFLKFKLLDAFIHL